jgi:hypothetical protein
VPDGFLVALRSWPAQSMRCAQQRRSSAANQRFIPTASRSSAFFVTNVASNSTINASPVGPAPAGPAPASACCTSEGMPRNSIEAF